MIATRRGPPATGITRVRTTLSGPLAPTGPLPESAAPADELDRAKAYARERHAPSTRRTYRTDFAIFSLWAASRGLDPLPADPVTVASFLASEADAGLGLSTLEHRMAAIRYAHRMAGHETPTVSEAVRATLAGIRRLCPTRPVAKAPATVDLIELLVAGCGADLHGLRDRALLLLGFAGAFRRSELAAIERAQLTWEKAGLRVFLPHSKTDQEGRGQDVAVLRGDRLCPVQALDSWLTAAGIIEGPIFRAVLPGGKVSARPLCDRNVALIIKRRALAAGLDPAPLSGHSLRSGFLTSAAEAGAGLFAMMDVSRHKSVETVRTYIRRADAFKNHAGKGLL